MAKEEIKYEDAVKELEYIVAQMENNELNIDVMGERLKKAQKLMKLCRDKLTKADQEVKKILDSGRA